MEIHQIPLLIFHLADREGGKERGREKGRENFLLKITTPKKCLGTKKKISNDKYLEKIKKFNTLVFLAKNCVASKSQFSIFVRKRTNVVVSCPYRNVNSHIFQSLQSVKKKNIEQTKLVFLCLD